MTQAAKSIINQISDLEPAERQIILKFLLQSELNHLSLPNNWEQKCEVSLNELEQGTAELQLAREFIGTLK